MASRPLSKKEREQLKIMFEGKCAYCGYELGPSWCADHIEPIYRKLKYARDPITGIGRMVAAGGCYRPDMDTRDNLFPCCGPCNIHKGVSSLEGWRKSLEDLGGVLQRNYPTYRHAVRFGMILETPKPVVFWFETYCTPKKAVNG